MPSPGHDNNWCLKEYSHISAKGKLKQPPSIAHWQFLKMTKLELAKTALIGLSGRGFNMREVINWLSQPQK